MEKLNRKDKIALIIGAILALLVIVLAFICGSYSMKLKIANHNIDALNDTITEVKLKNGDLLSSKNSFILEKQELEEYIGIKETEIKELERKLKDKILYIATMKQEFKTDTITMINTVYTLDSATYTYAFEDSTKYYKLKGYTDVDMNHNSTTTITNNEMYADLKVGLTDDWKIFVATDNPNLKFSNIDGALLDKDYYLSNGKNINDKKKKCSFGVQVQAGFGAQYGLKRKSFDVGPYLGVGFSWGYNF